MKNIKSSEYKTLNTEHGSITYAVADITSNNANETNSGVVNGDALNNVASNNVTSNAEVYIISYSGHDTELVIPDFIDGAPVTTIAKKAFLSNKLIREIILPKSIREIGDYAFARCDRLSKIGIPYTNISLGQGILMECSGLTQVVNVQNTEYKNTEYKSIQLKNIQGGEDIAGVISEKYNSTSGVQLIGQDMVYDKKTLDVSYLLAATMGILDAFYLFDLTQAGSDEWFTNLDIRMKSKLEMDDSEGFSKMLLCGEEDYGSNETDPEYYKHLKRLSKVRVAMLRLMHDYKLPEDVKEKLKAYLLMHIKGCKYEETWDVVKDEHGDDKDYYDFLTSIGAVNESNLYDMLNDLGDRHTEMKAYLMKYNDTLNDGKDAFDVFEL